jgi:hypothetical protein
MPPALRTRKAGDRVERDGHGFRGHSPVEHPVDSQAPAKGPDEAGESSNVPPSYGLLAPDSEPREKEGAVAEDDAHVRQARQTHGLVDVADDGRACSWISFLKASDRRGPQHAIALGRLGSKRVVFGPLGRRAPKKRAVEGEEARHRAGAEVVVGVDAGVGFDLPSHGGRNHPVRVDGTPEQLGKALGQGRSEGGARIRGEDRERRGQLRELSVGPPVVIHGSSEPANDRRTVTRIFEKDLHSSPAFIERQPFRGELRS